MSTYRAWDENDYPWPPPDGWYEGSDGKWWPEGYGPGPGTVIEPPPSAAAPAPDPVVPPPAAVPAPAPAPAAAPPPAAPVAGPPPAGGYAAAPGAAPAPNYEPAYAASPAPTTAGGGGGGNGKILAIVGGLVALLVLAGIGFFVLSGGDDDPQEATDNTEVPVATVGGDDTAGSDTTAAGSDSGSDTTAPSAGGDAVGSFDNPYDIGDGVVLFYDDFSTGEERRWLVEVLSPVMDITQAVADENQFNDPPGDGEVFAAARVRITYESGPAPANVFDLSFGAIGPSGRVLKTFEATCGVTPDSLDSFAELFPGGSVEGNVCWATPSGDVADLRMILEASGVDGQVYVNLN